MMSTKNVRTFNTLPISFRSEAIRGELLHNVTAEGMKIAEELIEVKEPKLFQKGIHLTKDSAASFSAVFSKSRPATKLLSRYAHASIHASYVISEAMGLNKEQIVNELQRIDIAGTDLLNDCPIRKGLSTRRAIFCPEERSYKFRKADGRCNNLLEPNYGQSMQPFHRFIQPDYSDGIQSPRQSMTLNRPLPNPRLVSTTVAGRHGNRPSNSASLMVMVWGQFLDHDLTHTALSVGFNGSKIRCCNVHFNDRHPECFPIEVSAFDPFYSKYGHRCMEFVRSSPVPKRDCTLGPREQINQITSFLDASNVYGSSEEESQDLRLAQDGKLKSTPVRNRKDLLPPISDTFGDDECRNHTSTMFCFRAGDTRCNEQPSLTAMHTMWQREHNRIADKLTRMNPHWEDERIFQETRRIVGAMMQHVTYNEWLPVVVGKEVLHIFRLDPTKMGHANSQHYDRNMNPTISNVFATAAFRFGHSLVQDSVFRRSAMHRRISNALPLHKELFNPISLHNFGSVDRILLGAIDERCQSADVFVSPQLTNRLFQKPGKFAGLDLVSMNIQRGREHGIPSYNRWREICGLRKIETFRQLRHVTSLRTANRISKLYSDVEDIDLFVGGLAENHLPGAMIGPTFACIIAQQFHNLKKGDRFWYENQGFPSSFTADQLTEIKKTSLARVICDNLDDVLNVQLRVMKPTGIGNRRVSCRGAQIRNVELRPWKDESYVWTEGRG
ncbi:Uncharacterised protein g8147 [Pycnogonum litorale]